MKKIYANAVSALFGKKYRKDIRRLLLNDKFLNTNPSNKIILVKNGIEKELTPDESITGLNIVIEGQNNVVKIYHPTRFQGTLIKIAGDGNEVCIKETIHVFAQAYINLSTRANKRKVYIDKNFSCNQVAFRLVGDNHTLTVGKDCMFSDDIDVMNGDSHKIFDQEGKLMNASYDKMIGNHVWIAAGCKILKNADINDGCIIGAGSVLTKTFDEKNAVIAGNPAKIVKRNIRWER